MIKQQMCSAGANTGSAGTTGTTKPVIKSCSAPGANTGSVGTSVPVR